MVKVKLFIRAFILLFWIPLDAQENNKPTNLCNTEVIQKGQKFGYRSLNFKEKISFNRNLKKCEDRVLAKSIKKGVNLNQLKADAENSKKFAGKTSSCAYCVMALIFYFILV